MHQDYFTNRLFCFFAGICNIQPAAPHNCVDGSDPFSQRVQDLFKKGEVVCVFPEEGISGNGLVGRFSLPLTHLLVDGVRVLPVYLSGLWGSSFSHYHGRIKPHFFNQPQRRVSIAFGEPVDGDISLDKLREKIVEIGSDSAKEPCKQNQPLHQQVIRNCRRYPLRKILFDHGKGGVTNMAFLMRLIIFSKKISVLTDKKTENIGILLPNGSAAACSIVASMMSGKVPAMLNYSVSEDVLKLSAEKSNLDCIITSKVFLKKAKLPALPQMVFLEDIAKEITFSDKAAAVAKMIFAPAKLIAEIDPDVNKPAVVIFSSGSSGVPKGVVLSHHNLNSNVDGFADVCLLNDNDGVMGNLPLFHSFGISVCFWMPLVKQVPVVYVANTLDSKAICNAIAEHGLSILVATPTFLNNYMRKSSDGVFDSLRLVVTGAEKLRPNISQTFKKKTGITVVEGYGCTELSPVVSCNVPSVSSAMGKRCGKNQSVGQPISGVSVKIVDPSSMEPLPCGEEGLMMVKGPNVMLGYLGDEDKTNEVLNDGWYNTGDIANVDEYGYITITGRLSRFSKIGGEMVPHEKVERAILDIVDWEQQPVAVCSASDDNRGEKLVVVYTPELQLEPSDVVSLLRDSALPNLWIPKASNFIPIDELPMLGTGKVDLKSLTEFATNRNSIAV